MYNIHKLKFGTINCQTLKDDVKLAQVVTTSKSLQQDLTFVQETHRIGCTQLDFEEELEGWRFINCGVKIKHAHGVGMIISPDTVIHDIDYIMNGRVLYARLTIKGIKLSAFSIYSPTNQAPENTKNVFYSHLRKAINSVKKDEPSFKVMIGGDMNATIGTDIHDSKYIGRNNDECPTNDNGERLARFCEDLDLYAMNTIFQTKRIHRYTWKSPIEYLKRLDYILVENFLRQYTTNCRVYRGASHEYESDHRLLVLDMKCPSRQMRKQFFRKRPPKPKPAIEYLKVDEVQKLYSEKLETLINEQDIQEDPDILEDIVVNSIENATRVACPVIQEKSRSPPWSNEEFLQMLEERRKCKNLEEKKNKTKVIKRARQRLKTTYYKKQATLINQAAEMRKVEEEFRLINNFKMSKSLTSKSNLIKTKKLTEHFKVHFGERKCEKQPEVKNPEQFPFLLPTIQEDIDESPPKEEEIKKAMKSLKNNKCMGTDKIHNEQLKYNNSESFLRLLTMMMCLIWTVVKFPASWCHSTISCLFKNKGKVKDAKNYRGLSINATLNKILMTVVLNRTRKMYENNILENQFGFRSNRSTADAIFVIKNTISKTEGFFIGCFVDLRAAYDHIDREMLFDVLKIRLGSSIIVNILRELYSNTTAAIKSASETFRTYVGCRQGAKESPWLFNIYLDFVLRICEHEVLKRFPNTGIRYKFSYPPECTNRNMRSKSPSHGTDHLRMLLYADDILVLARNVKELEEIMNIYHTVFKRFGLTIADDKTKTMTFNAAEDVASCQYLIQINGTPIENVRKFRYLGHVISNMDGDENMNTQIAAAHQKWSEMKDIFTDGDIALYVRVNILESCIRSRLLYAVQTWKLSAKEMRRIETVWLNFLRKLVKGGFARKHIRAEDEITEENWGYKYTNNDILRITKGQSISEFCRRQHLLYIAHVVRSENDCLTKRLLFSVPTRNHYRDVWVQYEKDCDIDRTNLRRIMMKKEEFKRWLTTTSSERRQ